MLSRMVIVACSCYLAVGVVRAETVLVVDIEMSGAFVPGPMTRCVCFRLFDCCNEPAEICQEVTFTNGIALGVELLVASDDYMCVEARDPLHTLRSVSRVAFDGTEYTASFVDDPEYGGNWLISGDLNGDDVIDVLDDVIYKYAIASGTSYPDGDTTCEAVPPHVDINGDGIITSLDRAFILDNFLAVSKEGCWEGPCSGPDKAERDGAGQSSTLVVDLQLSPVMFYGPVTRCICFAPFDCCSEPTETCQEITLQSRGELVAQASCLHRNRASCRLEACATRNFALYC